MNRIILIFFILAISFSLKAQDSTHTYFYEVGANVFYWQSAQGDKSPGSISTNFDSNTSFLAYFSYIRKGSVGIKLSYNYRCIGTTDQGVENEYQMHNIRLGLDMRLLKNRKVGFSFSTGMQLIAPYELDMQIGNNPSLDDHIYANGVAMGVYFNMGVNIKIFKRLYFNTFIDYSFIPKQLEYSNTIQNVGVTFEEKIDFGGIGIQSGLSWRL